MSNIGTSVDWYPSSNLSIGKKVVFPANLKFRPFNVFENDGSYTTSIIVEYLVSSKIDKMKPYYVNYQTGNNQYNGLSEATPFKTIAAAYANGARLIYLTGGVHKIDSWSLLNSAYANIDDLFIIGIGKEPNIVCSAPAVTPAVTLQSGTTYQTTDPNIKMAVDLNFVDEYGFPLKLKEHFNLEEVNVTNGSYYLNTATNTLYFNLPDGRMPDSKVLLLSSLRNAEYRSNRGYHYVENITFMGGGSTTGTHGVRSDININSSLVHLAKDCKFLYGQATNYTSNGGEGTRNLYNKINWFQNCISYSNARDGFNYLSDISNPMNFIEVDCQSFGNDWRQAAHNVNGSSFHGPGYGIRVNFKAFDNSGPNIADVDGAITFNINCETANSKALNPLYNSDYAVESNPNMAPTEMYLYDCKSKNSNTSYSITGSQPSYIFLDPLNSSKGKVQIISPLAPQAIIKGDFESADSEVFVFPPLSAFVAREIKVTNGGDEDPTISVGTRGLKTARTWYWKDDNPTLYEKTTAGEVGHVIHTIGATKDIIQFRGNDNIPKAGVTKLGYVFAPAVILPSPNGSKWMLTVSNDGQPVFTIINPPV